MVRRTVKRIALVGVAVAAFAGLSGCPSPLLAIIKNEVARAPFTGTAYSFVKQWGNAHPEYSFMPTAQVKTDPAGYVYVADSSFRVRKFTAAGTLVKTFSLQSAQGLFGQIYDMAFDASGNMFITNSVPQVQMYDVNGNFVRQWGSSSNFSQYYTLGITVDNGGSVYVVDAGNNNVQKFDSQGNSLATWGGVTTYAGLTLYRPRSIATDNTYLYVLDTGDSYTIRGRVVKLAASDGTYSTSWGGAATLYPAVTGSALSQPYGISVGAGNVYIADTNNSTANRVIETDTFGNYATRWGTTGTSAGQFTSPNSVAIDTSGYAYVVDEPSNGGADGRVQKFNVSSPATPLAVWGGPPGTANGIVDFPEGVAFDSDGNLYVVDSGHDRIQKFDSTGNYILQWGTTGTGPGQFEFSNGGSFGLAVDSARNRIYVSDSGYSDSNGYGRVQSFDLSGGSAHVVALPGSGQLQVSDPSSVALDSQGNLYIADNGNYRVEIIDPNGYYSARSFGNPSGSYETGDGLFGNMFGIAVDSSGNIYVSDAFLNKVQKFSSSGLYLSKIAAAGSGNGQISLPLGITVDGADNLWIADLANRRVQKFDSTGTYAAQISGAGVGNGTFGYPAAMAVDSKGRVVVTDVANNLIQLFSPTF